MNTVQKTENPIPQGGIYATLPRMLSLLMAIGMAGVIFTYPKGLVHVSHGIVVLILLGVSAGFVHGVGFVPEAKVWRIVFWPFIAWGVMSLGLWFLLHG